jgi:Protein of unknown function (DUF4231)
VLVDAELLKKVGAQYTRLDRRASRWQRLHVGSRGVILVLGFLSVLAPTIRVALSMHDVSWLSGWQTRLEVVSGWLVVILPAVTAGITALSGLVNAPQGWIANRTGAEMLKSEAFLYATGAGKYEGDRDAALLENSLIEVEALVDEWGAADGLEGA